MEKLGRVEVYKVILGGPNKYALIQQLIPELGEAIVPSTSLMLEGIAKGADVYSVVWREDGKMQCEIYPENPVEVCGQKPKVVVEVDSEGSWKKLAQKALRVSKRDFYDDVVLVMFDFDK